jgi:predicted ABC-type ATPase
MLERIDTLMKIQKDFAIETTLATRSYVDLIKRARQIGYKVTLVYFWLSSPEEAKQRVAIRVSKGGHFIPDDIVERRYYRGLHNLIHLYLPVCDFWMILSNAMGTPDFISEGEFDQSKIIYNKDIWNTIQHQGNGNKT